MAAKLEWKGDELRLGPWTLARICQVLNLGWHYAIPDAENGLHGPYEEPGDARQDAESEVRRLLRDAGVVLAD